MRILHTSDWHIGVSPDQAPRHQEHALFLDWLIQQIDEHDVEVLVNAGDTFHYMQPSARALRMHYDFLARCARETKLKQIVLTGGNHDSASRIDAPAEILNALDVHVVGGLAGDASTWDRCLCPIFTPDGHAQAVIMAVPYVHESRLGVTTAGKTPKEIRDAMIKGFADLYSKVADLGEAAYPDIPLVATGHLTCYPDGTGQVEGAYHTPIHLIEALGSLPPKIFDLRYSYVALGHVHQHMEIAGPNAWYCGSPIPTDVTETRTSRHVLLVDVDPEKPRAHAQVTKLTVPTWRPAFELFGPADDVFDQVKNLEWNPDKDLRPYLYLDLHVDAPMPDAIARLDDVMELYDDAIRPRIIRCKETLISPLAPAGVAPEVFQHTPLSEMDPTEVFEKMFTIKHGQAPTEELMLAFRSLLAESGDGANT